MRTESCKEEKVSRFWGSYCCCNDLLLTLQGDVGCLSGLFGYSSEEIKSVFQNSLYQLIVPEERTGLRQRIEEQLEAGDDIELLIPVEKKDGPKVWVLNRAERIIGEDGKEYLQGVLVDITMLKQLYDEKKKEEKKAVHDLQEQAEKDELTKLFNVRTVRRLAEEYFSTAEAENCALMILDLDDFKQVNDQYGHMFGDDVLAQSARIIRELFRCQDIVGRIGGDEFVVLMKNVSDKRLVDRRCRQLIASFQNEFEDEEKGCQISCSIGVVICEAKQAVYNELFQCADKALYQAKAQGKNQFVFGQMD